MEKHLFKITIKETVKPRTGKKSSPAVFYIDAQGEIRNILDTFNAVTPTSYRIKAESVVFTDELLWSCIVTVKVAEIAKRFNRLQSDKDKLTNKLFS